MASVKMPVQLAPSVLDQSILPNWGFSLFTIDLGQSSNAGLERVVLDRVGSYGKQLGHLADALDVVIRHAKLQDNPALSKEDRTALVLFQRDVDAVRRLKQVSRQPRR